MRDPIKSRGLYEGEKGLGKKRERAKLWSGKPPPNQETKDPRKLKITETPIGRKTLQGLLGQKTKK